MLHDVLRNYRCYLESKYSPATARTYAIRLAVLFKGQKLTAFETGLDFDKILKNLSAFHYKNPFSQAKNALLHYCSFQNIPLSDEILNTIKDLESNTHKKYRHLKVVDYRQVEKTIQSLKNKKLRLSYQVMASTGLRVAELAGIRPSDCTISKDHITFKFTAKGGNTETVVLAEDEYSALYQNIKELLDNTPPKKKLFYSAIHLQIQAKKLGFTCHDLRRAFAKLTYKKSRSKTEVMKLLRQASLKNTNIYLRSRIKL